MKKYIKPRALNLGDLLPEARGNCTSGASAGSLPPCGGGTTNPGFIQHCGAGPFANGSCNDGAGADPSCVTGTGHI
jgi:hypothetical protein